ncbi:MFS transporter [Mammaliicoccus sciuri]|uniref:MFS transporter n=1 Tax=Mammaliicoccus sciuri TaxID=1296 RepID=UPI00397A136C
MKNYEHKYKLLILYLLCISAFFASLNQNIYTPIIPLIRDSFDVSINWVNASVGSFIFIMAIVQIILGSFIDNKSQKNIITTGLIITAISTFLCIFTENFVTFFIFRIIQAIGTAIIPLVTINMIAKLFDGHSRGSAMATYQILLTLAPAIAPVLGGFIGDIYGFEGIFTFLSVISMILLISFIFIFPKDKPVQNKIDKSKSVVLTYKNILSNKEGMTSIILGFFVFFIYFGILVYLPVLLTDHYHISIQIVGLLYLPLTLSMVIGSFLYKYIQTNIRLQTMFNSVSVLMPVLVILFGLLHDKNIVLLSIILFIYGLTLGFAPPLFSTIISNTYNDNSGAALGLFNFVRYTGMALGSLISGVYVVISLNLFFVILGIILIVLSMISFNTRKV